MRNTQLLSVEAHAAGLMPTVPTRVTDSVALVASVVPVGTWAPDRVDWCDATMRPPELRDLIVKLVGTMQARRECSRKVTGIGSM